MPHRAFRRLSAAVVLAITLGLAGPPPAVAVSDAEMVVTEDGGAGFFALLWMWLTGAPEPEPESDAAPQPIDIG